MENSENEQEIFKRIQSQNGKKGGDTTFARRGSAHFTRISKKGVKARKAKKDGK